MVAGINRRLDVSVTDKLKSRVLSRIASGDASECWPWTACLRNGYGALKVDGRVHSAHRLAFICLVGEVPDGMIVAHKCDNKICCNPSHLEAVSPGQNNRDARGRVVFNMCRGEEVWSSVLNESAVAKIWELRKQGLGADRIAAVMNATRSSVKHVIVGRTWKHLMPDWARK